MEEQDLTPEELAELEERLLRQMHSQRLQLESIRQLQRSTQSGTIAALRRDSPSYQPNTPSQSTEDESLSEEDIQEILEERSFAKMMEKYAYAVYPDIYNEAVQKPNYDPEYWSWSLKHLVPVYTKGMSAHMLTTRKVMYNDVLYRNGNRNTLNRNRNKEGHKERFYAIQDPNYVPRGMKTIVLRSNIPRPVEVIERTATSRLVKKNLVSQGLSRVKHDPNARYLASSLTVGDLRTYEPDIGLDVPGLDTLTERAFFNGAVTETEYVIDMDYFQNADYNENTFRDIIIKTLFQLSSNDETKDNLPPYYSLYLWYGHPEITRVDATTGETYTIEAVQQRTFVTSGTVFDFDQNFNINENLRDLIYKKSGSDVIELQSFLSDMDRFVIQRVDLTRSGGCEAMVRHYLENPTRSKTHSAFTLSWGKVINYHQKGNGCFIKILNEQGKIDNGEPFARTYRQLWRELSLDTYEEQLTFEQASEIAETKGYRLIIYNTDGEIIYPSDNIYTGPKLMVMFYEDHYFHVTRLIEKTEKQKPSYRCEECRKCEECANNEKICSKCNGCKECKTGNDRNWETVLVYYDLETVFIEEAGSESYLRPYSLSWNVEYGKLKKTNFVDPNYTVNLDVPKITIFDKMFKDLRSLGPYKRFKLVAYNGSGFDHILLFKYLVQGGYSVINHPNASGRVYNMKFWIPHNNSSKTPTFSILEVWDPMLFIMKSLNDASRDFGFKEKKLPYDHEEVQKFYSQGLLKQFLQENEKLIVSYNSQDVTLLKNFTEKLIDTIHQITNISKYDILNTPTISALCYKIWNKGNKFITNAAPSVDIDEKIRSASVGGRVEGVPGIYHGEFVMRDVVSLYPTVMKNNYFPCGNILIAKSEEQLLEYWSKGLLGFLNIRYDQTSLSTEHTILPERIEKLYWIKGQGQGFVPRVTVELLQKYNADIEIIPDEDGVYGIFWSDQGKVFEDYVKQLENKKNEQDLFKKNKDPKYNQSLREMLKLMLNSLSGKVIQKQFKRITNMAKSEKEFVELLDHLREGDYKNWTDKRMAITPLGKNIAFVEYTDKDRYVKPKPSQLGVFIYAYARAYMFEQVFSKTHVYYTDTDSAVISKEDDLKLENSLKPDNRDKVFGDLELEEGIYRIDENTVKTTTDFDIVLVIAPKIYALYKGNYVAKYRVKGVKKTDEFYDPDDDTWKIIEKIETDEDGNITKYIRNVEKFYELLSRRFEQPDFKVKIRGWQFRKRIVEGELTHHYITKNI